MLYEIHFLYALVITWLVEVPLLVLLVRYIGRVRDLSAARIAGTGLLASALTLPYLWFVLPSLVDPVSYVLAGELLVIGMEAVIFSLLLRVRPVAAFLLSLVVNAASYLLGLWFF